MVKLLKVKNMPCFNLKPASIIGKIKIKVYLFRIAAYGHMGRKSKSKQSLKSKRRKKDKCVETFTWEN